MSTTDSGQNDLNKNNSERKDYQILPYEYQSEIYNVRLKRQPDERVAEILDRFLQNVNPEDVKLAHTKALENIAWLDEQQLGNKSVMYECQEAFNAVRALLDYLYTPVQSSIYDIHGFGQPKIIGINCEPDLFTNTVDIKSDQGVMIDQGTLWSRGNEKFVAFDEDEYISCSLNNPNIVKTNR